MDSLAATSFAHVTYEDALQSAIGLIPLLREHASEGELERHMPAAVAAALHRSGLIRALQPKRWGGMELKLSDWVGVLDKLGQGDCSVAWNVANLTLHHRTLALFDAQAQREVWGQNPDAMIAAGIAYVQGRARRVDGGLVISGTWNFCSGVVGAQWNMLACVLKEDDKPVDWVQCILRDNEYQIIDDWNTMGMRGTSSCSVKVDELFVPEYRLQSMATALPGHVFKGASENTNPMFRMPTTAYGGHTPAACIVGAAQGGVDMMVDWVRSRSTSYTGARMRDFAMVQWRIGLASAKVDTARLLLRNDCLEGEARMAMEKTVGETFDNEYKLRVKRNGAVAVRMAVEAVDLLHEMAGANGIYDTAPLQKIFRDVHAASAHIHFNMDVQMTQWGLVKLGGEFKSPTF